MVGAGWRQPSHRKVRVGPPSGEYPGNPVASGRVPPWEQCQRATRISHFPGSSANRSTILPAASPNLRDGLDATSSRPRPTLRSVPGRAARRMPHAARCSAAATRRLAREAERPNAIERLAVTAHLVDMMACSLHRCDRSNDITANTAGCACRRRRAHGPDRWKGADSEGVSYRCSVTRKRPRCAA